MSVFHASGISAVWRRQLGSLLGNPLGYIFILAFVLIAGAFIFLPDEFYNRNLADLGTLLPVMPWLLVILLPALAMNAWASEREQGTEELLLTMPMSTLDAVLGKYLAVASYFTLALLCSLSNVAVLMWLGSPDVGLVAANYIGWWLAGLACTALGLLASVQVSMPAVAFVIGVLYCAIAMWGAHQLEWFDAFNRGVLTLAGIISALCVVVGSLGIAVLQLSSRRWRPSGRQDAINQVLTVTLGLIVAVNVARISERYNVVESDVSVEGLSSISPASIEVIQKLESPVTIATFISKELPESLALKAKEVEDKVKALERSSGGKVRLERIRRPADVLDEIGQFATQHYGLKPFKSVVDTVSGKEQLDVFLGVAVVSGSRSQVIGSFDPGLSVEYELVRAVRAVGRAKKPVLGIAMTDLKMTADFDFQSGQMRQPWQMIDEMKKQYEIREVNLDTEVAADVDVLMVPLPSSLTTPQVEKLHDYIWAGRPTLIMEDPLPMFTGPQLAPSMPKRSAGNPYQQQAPEQKADLKPLYRALGLDFDLNSVVWSGYNPNHELRDMLPPAIVWLRRDQKSVLDASATTGIDSLLFPFPGALYEAPDKSPSLTITPLLKPASGSSWGKHQFSDYITQGYMGMQQTQPKRWLQGDAERIPSLAVLIEGQMPSAYPKIDPNAKSADKKDDDKKTDGKDAKKDSGTTSDAKTGVLSTNKIHVVVIADTDFASDQFFEMYRSAGAQMPKEMKDKYVDLFNLRNVQFLANAIDSLAGDQGFLSVRTRRAIGRPLTRLQNVVISSEKYVRDQKQVADQVAEDAIAKANKIFNDKLSKIDDQEGLDDNAKAQLKANVETVARRQLNDTLTAIDIKKEQSERRANIERKRAIDHDRLSVRWFALVVPASVMVLLIMGVSANRIARERSHIPAARKRVAISK